MAAARLTALLLDIDFRAGGNSEAYLLDGWAEQEPEHRWSMGRQSRLRLPRTALHAGNVLVVCATPCVDPPGLTGQTVRLALDGRLLATLHMPELHVAAWRLPPGLAGEGDAELSFVHLSQSIARRRTKIRNRVWSRSLPAWIRRASWTCVPRRTCGQPGGGPNGATI